MPKLLPLCLALAALGACGTAAAQDVRQEDRRADRQEDRRVERQEDRREDRGLEAREAQARLELPRNADGTLDAAALERAIRERFAAGVTEIQFRGLTGQDAQRLLLERNQSLLTELAPLLPNDGVERQVRLRGAVDARIQRNDEGELRARIEGINVGTLTSAGRADLARQLAASGGLDRLRIRGVDADGERVRIEFRDDRGIVKNEARGGRREDRRADRGEDRRADHREDRPERFERQARAERPERMERAERQERVERPEHGGHGPH